MNDSAVNFTKPEASSNSTAGSNELMENLIICVHCINFLFGFPTHCYVIWNIITGTKTGVALLLFNLNVSVCETGNCLISFFYIFLYYTGFSNLTRIQTFLTGLTITGRPLFQCLICVERYLAVVHPVTFLKYKPLRYRVICSAAVWIITLGSCLVSMFTMEWFYVYMPFFSIQFLLFFLIQLFCLVAVLRALKQSGPGERKRETNDKNHTKRKAFSFILITTVTIFFIYLPFVISGFFFIVTKQYIVQLFSFGFICNVLAGFVQPVLYLHRNGKLSCLCCP